MILLILFVSLLIRLIAISQSLWLDEGINVVFAKTLDFKTLIFSYSLGDFHPPLYHLILKSAIQLAGASELAVRLPSIIFGVATVYLTYLIGKKLYDAKTGLIASILLATSPLHIYYSQEARMYSLAAFAVSLSVFFFISILQKDKLIYWVGFVMATSIMLYSDYLPYLLIPVYILFLIIFRKSFPKSTLVSFLPAALLILIVIFPWFLIFPKQLETGLLAASSSPAWSNVVGAASLKNLILTFVKFTIGRVSNDNNLRYILLFLPAGIYVIFLFALSLLRISKLRSFLFFWFSIPILLAFVISYFVPVFAYFRFIFILPAFYLIWASAINTLNWKVSSRFLLLIALFINLTSSSIYFLNPKFQREDWKTAVNYVHSNADEKSIVLFESTSTIAPFDYYNLGKVEARGVLDSFSPNPEKVSENIQITSSKDRIFLFQYLSEITDKDGVVFQQLTKSGFKNSKTTDFQNIGFLYEFTR